MPWQLHCYFELWVALSIFGLTMPAFTWLLGGRVSEVSIGFAPVAHWRWRGVPLHLGLIPGSWVKIAGLASDDPDDAPGSFRRLNLGRRLAIILGPWVAVAVVAVIALGPEGAWRSMLRAPGQLLQWDPRPALRGLRELFEHAPAAQRVGAIAAKLTAFNLLPIPTLAGWTALRQLQSSRQETQGVPSTWEGRANLAGLGFVFFYMTVRFAVGICLVARGG